MNRTNPRATRTNDKAARLYRRCRLCGFVRSVIEFACERQTNGARIKLSHGLTGPRVMDLATAVWLCGVSAANGAEPHGGVSRHQIDAPSQAYKGEGAEQSRDIGLGGETEPQRSP